MLSVEKLKSRVKEQQKQIEKDRQEHYNEREVIIKQSLDYVVNMDFWCDKCQKDFVAPAHKHIQRIIKTSPDAFYEGRCVCGAWCRRFITDKHQDPYYRKSKLIQMLRERYRKDMLQPSEQGFNTLYGDPNKAIYEKMEQDERKRWKSKIMIVK